MRIDRATWSTLTSPSPPPADGAPFFGTRTMPADVLVAEHAYVHARVAQVRAGLDSGDGHESYAWILEILADRIAEDCAHRLVDTPHEQDRRGHMAPGAPRPA